MRNRMRVSIVAVLAAAVLLLVACSSGGGTTPTSTNPEPPGPIELTAKDSGSTQQMQTGQELLITLDANPTTGYEWAVDGDVPPQLEQSGEAKYSTESTLAGAGGTQRWVFVAKSAGQGALKLKYWRSFEPSATPVQTFEVGVDVK